MPLNLLSLGSPLASAIGGAYPQYPQEIPANPIDITRCTITVTANGVVTTTATYGGTQRTITFEARDAGGARITSVDLSSVTFTQTGVGTVTLGSVTDNADGTASATLDAVLAGSVTLGATYTGSTITATSTITTLPSSTVNVAASTVTCSHTEIVEAGTATVVVYARDAGTNQLAAGGLTVTLAASGGTAQVSIGSTTDNSNGTYTIIVTGVADGTATTLTPSIGGTPMSNTVSLAVSDPAAVQPIWSDDFESYNEDDLLPSTPNPAGYYWGSIAPTPPSAGVGANGSFVITAGGLIVDDMIGDVFYGCNSLNQTPAPTYYGPFTVTSNTTNTIYFTGDATGALYGGPDRRPQVSTAEAHNGTKSLRFTWGPDSIVTGADTMSNSEQRFFFGSALTEFWMEFWILYPYNSVGSADYTHRKMITSIGSNNKFLALWHTVYSVGGRGDWRPLIETIRSTLSPPQPSEYGASQFNWKTTWYGNNTNIATTSYAWAGGTITTSNYNFCQDAQNPVSGTTFAITPGTWARFRYYLKESTSDTANNGIVKIWVNDTKMLEITDGKFWPTPPEGHHGIQRGYLLGWANSGFSSLTHIYVDEWKVYAQNPGWE